MLLMMLMVMRMKVIRNMKIMRMVMMMFTKESDKHDDYFNGYDHDERKI